MTKKDLEQYFIPSLTLLETDLTETELLFRKIIFTEQAFPSQKRQPAYGPEEAGYVFFRWSYELPGGPFTGLKKTDPGNPTQNGPAKQLPRNRRNRRHSLEKS